MLAPNSLISKSDPGIQSAASDVGATQIEDSATLLLPLAQNLDRLADLADATDVHFVSYYLPVLEKLATFLQKLPSASDNQKALLEIRVSAAEMALQRRRGYLLPQGAEPEILAKESDLWAYAVFTLSLLQGLAMELSRLDVELYNDCGECLGPWKPWCGFMIDQGAHSYCVKRIGSPPSADWTPLLISYLIPRQTHEWFWANRSVLKVWLEILTTRNCPSAMREILSLPPDDS